MKLAFIKAGSFSHTNANVQALLERRLPNACVETTEVYDLVLRKTLANLSGTLQEKGLRALLDDQPLFRHLFSSQHFFAKTRQALLRRLSGRDYAFTTATTTLTKGGGKNFRGGRWN